MGVEKSTFTFSNSSIVLDGGTTTINITRDNQLYSHKLLHGYGQFAALPVNDTSHIWSPTAEDLVAFWREVPSQKTRLIDVYLDTYNDSTFVGRDIHSLTVTLSEETGKPTVDSFRLTDAMELKDSLGVIVSGLSNIEASKNTEAKYGARIAKTVYTYGSKEYSNINDLIGSLPATTTPTSFNIGCKTVDTRGFAATTSTSELVVAYKQPEIDTFEVIRCDTSGNENVSGTKAKIVATGSWTAMKVGNTYKNTATLKIGYKKKSATSYNAVYINVSAGTVNINQLLNATLIADDDYEFEIELRDSLNVACTKSGVPFLNAKNIINVSSDGNEIEFGANKVIVGGYDLVRKNLTVSVNTGACSTSYLQAYVMGGMCFVSGLVHNNFAGTSLQLITIIGVKPVYNTAFPMACYGGDTGAEGLAMVDGDNTALKFNVPSVRDWRFNFAFAIE